jgi:hypothetical protein
MLKKISVLAFCAVSSFAMHNAEININDTDLEIGAQFDMGQFNDAIEPETMFLGAKFLNGDESNSDTKIHLDPFYEVSFLSMNAIGNKGMSLGMGVKVNHTKKFTALPLGLEASYILPFQDLVPMRLHASLYFAPRSLAFSDGDSYLEYRLDYNVAIIPHGNLVVGYRHMDTNYKTVDCNYNASLYFGFKIGF